MSLNQKFAFLGQYSYSVNFALFLSAALFSASRISCQNVGQHENAATESPGPQVKSILYQSEDFKGIQLEIDDTDLNRCITFRYHNSSDGNFDNRASAVHVGQNCLILHERIGCTGRNLTLSPNQGVHCHHDLGKCNFNDVATSVSFCNATIPSNYDIPMGYRGSPCVSACESRDNPYFGCNVENGTWDYCSPRPGIDFLGSECYGECVIKDTSFPQSVILYDGLNYKGNQYRLEKNDREQIQCMNFRSSCGPQISSVYLDSSCVRLYDSIGCTGKYFELASDGDWRCWDDVRKCKNYNTIASAQLCTTVLPSLYTPPIGSGGEPCVTPCVPRERHYFWCKLGNGSMDIGTPRPGQNYLGEDWHATSNLSKYGFDTRPALFQSENFKGIKLEIDDTHRNRCITFRYHNNSDTNFDNRASAAHVGRKCLFLHEYIGCTGRNLTLSLDDGLECHHDLGNCDFNDVTTSVSFCGAQFPPYYESPVSYTGRNCVDTCETRGKPYFWCNLPNETWDYCSPRPGLDFLGNECDGSCTNDTTFPQSVVLYEGKSRRGNHHRFYTKNEAKMNCINFRYRGGSRKFREVHSVYIDSSCVRLYDSIGCTGKSFELTAESDWRCWNDLPTCKDYNTIASARLCTTVLPPLFTSPLGLQGSSCVSPCVARERFYFWCTLENGYWDFCTPRPGQNPLGETLEANTPSKAGWYLEESNGPILYDQANFSGSSLTLTSLRKTRCANIATNNQTFYANTLSIDVKWDCLLLFENIGCSGEFLEVFPDDAGSCHLNLEACAWNSRVSSISLCQTYLTEKYAKPKGSRGEECMDSCDAGELSCFHCQDKRGAWDYCLPRPGQDYFGNDCEGNCSIIDTTGCASLESSKSSRSVDAKHGALLFWVIWMIFEKSMA